MATVTKLHEKSWPFFLDGKWRAEGEPVQIRSPYDNSVVGSTFRGSAAHAETAIRAAVRAFDVTRKMPAFERKRILLAVSDALRSRSEEFARLMALEAGKPLRTARVEVDRCVFTFATAAEEAVRISGEYLPLDGQAAAAGRAGIVRRFPIGPILAITPFNFPLNLVAHKVAPAMAAGCTAVVKPAPQTPLTALLLAEVIEKAGWPAGALNVLPLANPEAERLVSEAALVHGQRSRRLVSQAEIRKEKSRPRTRRQRGRYRPFRRRRRSGRAPLHPGRLLLRRTELHLRPAHFRSRQRRKEIHRCAQSRRPEIEDGRSAR